jgi:hypothetical protein
MKALERIAALTLAAAVGLTAGCGQEPASTAAMAASLLIPRDLADDLTSVTIYVIETDKETHLPDCFDLLGDTDAYDDRVVKKKTVDFDPQGTSALITGIPDRGRVWRFYARGFQNDTLIAHGCVDGLRDVLPDETITLDIELTRID